MSDEKHEQTTACVTCLYVFPIPDGRYQCRWGPPVPIPRFAEGSGGRDIIGQDHVVPLVNPDYFCGQYKRAPGPTQQPAQ